MDGKFEPLGNLVVLGAVGVDGSCVLGSDGVDGSCVLGSDGVDGSCVLGRDVVVDALGVDGSCVLGSDGVEGSPNPVAASDVTATVMATTNTTAAIRQTLP